jgi:hypothetical protein
VATADDQGDEDHQDHQEADNRRNLLPGRQTRSLSAVGFGAFATG